MTDAIPPRLRERWRTIWPADQADALLATFATPKDTTFRVSSLRAPQADTLEALRALGFDPQPVAGTTDGFSLPPSDRDALVRAAPVIDGRAYLQDPASWVPVHLLDPQPGEEILDLCAAPGGKSLQIADRMQNRGRLACVEAIRDRFFRMKSNLDRGGVKIAALYMKDGRHVGGAVPARFDRVMLDAPCSSEAGVEADNPDTWKHWSERKLAECSRKQHGLIRSAWTALKPGGTMVYATCTFAPEEDELVIDGLLRERDDVEVLEARWPWTATQPGLTSWDGEALDPRLTRTLRVLPGPQYGGFFCALLRKSDD